MISSTTDTKSAPLTTSTPELATTSTTKAATPTNGQLGHLRAATQLATTNFSVVG